MQVSEDSASEDMVSSTVRRQPTPAGADPPGNLFVPAGIDHMAP